jgi:hypothetical protein
MDSNRRSRLFERKRPIAELNPFRTFLGALASQYNDTRLVRPSMERLLRCPVFPQKKSAFTPFGDRNRLPAILTIGDFYTSGCLGGTRTH